MTGTEGTETRAVHREEWLDAGACRTEDPDLFFPITASGPSARQIEAAKAVCHRCGVRDQCLHYALESHQSYGVWGGTSEEERSHLSPAKPADQRLADQRLAEQRPSEQRPVGRRPVSARRPSRRIRSGREGRNVGYRA